MSRDAVVPLLEQFPDRPAWDERFKDLAMSRVWTMSDVT